MKRTRTFEIASELGRLIGRTRRVVWNAIAEPLREVDESIYTWQLLLHVVRRRGANQRELASLTLQHPAGVSRALEELEGRGLVRRERDRLDRRKIIVEPTADGLAYFERIYPSVVVAIDGALGALSQAERLQLRDLLYKVAAPTFEADLQRSRESKPLSSRRLAPARRKVQRNG